MQAMLKKRRISGWTLIILLGLLLGLTVRDRGRSWASADPVVDQRQQSAGSDESASVDAHSRDKRVKAFLAKNKPKWRGMNIPVKDGRFMHRLIVERGYTSGLEIGTSTGHSSIWIAWALGKNGGKLITVEIDEKSHRQALVNFKQAGLSEIIDARLADAHELVKKLEGPFDFVFSDADKDWYKQYFIDIAPKLKVGGCFVSHNIWMHRKVIREYVAYLKSRKDFETTIERSKTSGVAISCRVK